MKLRAILYLGCICLLGTNGQNIEAIQDAAGDTSLFWFGDSYGTDCPTGSTFDDIDCFNPLEVSGKSLATLVSADPSNLEKELKVSYRSPQGSYYGCKTTFERTSEFNFDLDPLDVSTNHTPWDMRNEPSVTWDLDAGKQYTLLVSNVGFGVLQAIYTNLDSTDLSGKAALEYRGPRDIRPKPTPVVFFLFEQTQSYITIDNAWLQRFNDTFMLLDVEEFKDLHSLTGPVAMTWGQVGFDEYAAELQRQEGFSDNCPFFVHEALVRDQYRPFLPNNIQLTVDVEIEFYSPAFEFESCCADYSFGEETFWLDPIGSGFFKASSTRTNDTTRKFSLTKRKIKPDFETDFSGTWWTLLMVDPDVAAPEAGSIEKPLVHWVITDIQILNGIIGDGTEIHYYRGPMPPDQLPHTYYYLLLQQQGKIDVTSVDKYANNGEDCGTRQGRCLFDVDYFMRDNNLSLEGITWMVSGNDAFVNQSYIERGQDPDILCQWTPGYENPCPTSNATIFSGLFWTVFITLFYIIFKLL